jgi:hypothetical protein
MTGRAVDRGADASLASALRRSTAITYRSDPSAADALIVTMPHTPGADTEASERRRHTGMSAWAG